MAVSLLPTIPPPGRPPTGPEKSLLTRRGFLKTSLLAAGGLALYSGEIERHWIDISRFDVALPTLPATFDGMRIAQISDIHMDNFTEPFFLRHIVDLTNSLKPDAVVLTGDFVTSKWRPSRDFTNFAVGSAWQCANILTGLECKARYAVLGNHDFGVGPQQVTEALTDNGITVLRNAYLPIERGGARFWLAGVDDPFSGQPDPELAIPPSIQRIPNEPVVLLCHAPDYADYLLRQSAGQAVDLMLSGHTHGGQIRIPFLRPFRLPPLGRKYVEGWFHLDRMQLYVNRGVGAIGLPFRFNCPPEITLFTLRARA
ncbi:MAG TPA: metallophosphoesterase [Terracidiphilus sp.]|nr:metallophosphoesterase [Terracidiphilus sp.]